MSTHETLHLELQSAAGTWVEVGFLRKSNGTNWFEFSESYWNVPGRPVLGQIFEERGRAFRPSARVALPTWFSHLLPEGRLRQAVADAANTKSVKEFELFARIGQDDLPGALRATSVRSTTDLNPPKGPLVESSDIDSQDPILKFSLAGTQLKFSVSADGRGLTVPAKGQAGNVILKLPDGRAGFAGVPEAELGCLELARSSGIAAPTAQLWRPSDVAGLERWAARSTGNALAVHRFDRGLGDHRVHMEELAQVLNIPTKPDRSKYDKANCETIANLAAALVGPDAVLDVIDRIVLNILVGNGDAHLKNWALLYPDGRRPTLSPVYDVLPTVLYIPADDLGLRLGGEKRFEAINKGHFGRLGDRSGIGADIAVRRAGEATERIMNSWRTLMDYLTVDQYERLTTRHGTLSMLSP